MKIPPIPWPGLGQKKMQFYLVFSLCVHGIPSWGCCWNRKGVIRGDVRSIELPEEQMELSICWEKLYLAHLLHIPRGSDLYSAAAEEKESYCIGSCCPVIE